MRPKGLEMHCAYCGVSEVKLEREHVVPRCFYPPAKAVSKIQRLVVLACRPCNRGWSDDEVHARNVLLTAGEPNAAARELWASALRSFAGLDGQRRVRELAALFVPAPNAGPGRYMVYPAHDERVLRVLRKIVRGLSHDHEIESAVADHRVLVDILKYQIPDELMVAATEFHRERDIIEYGYALYDSGELSSAWTVRLFGKVIFIAWIRRSLS